MALGGQGPWHVHLLLTMSSVIYAVALLRLVCDQATCHFAVANEACDPIHQSSTTLAYHQQQPLCYTANPPTIPQPFGSPHPYPHPTVKPSSHPSNLLLDLAYLRTTQSTQSTTSDSTHFPPSRPTLDQGHPTNHLQATHPTTRSPSTQSPPNSTHSQSKTPPTRTERRAPAWGAP